MTWDVMKHNLYKFSHPPDVLQFCCDEVLPNIKSNQINDFTERHCRDETITKILFCSNPAYRADSGQECDVWYDWATFDHEGRNVNT